MAEGQENRRHAWTRPTSEGGTQSCRMGCGWRRLALGKGRVKYTHPDGRFVSVSPGQKHRQGLPFCTGGG